MPTSTKPTQPDQPPPGKPSRLRRGRATHFTLAKPGTVTIIPDVTDGLLYLRVQMPDGGEITHEVQIVPPEG